jgi:hypothetical protein
LRFLDGCLTPRRTGRLTVDRNIKLTFDFDFEEAGSNTSTSALLVVEGDEKGI